MLSTNIKSICSMYQLLFNYSTSKRLMSYSTIRHLLLILFLSFTSITLSAKTSIAINGLPKHFNTPLVRNPYNTGIGYIYNSHEVGIYRNSRRSTFHSIYYTWNRHLVDFQKTSSTYITKPLNTRTVSY